MRCQTAISQLGSLLDLELSPLQRGGLESHLLGCAPCRAYWRSYQQTVSLARGAYSADARPPAPENSLPRARDREPN